MVEPLSLTAISWPQPLPANFHQVRWRRVEIKATGNREGYFRRVAQNATIVATLWPLTSDFSEYVQRTVKIFAVELVRLREHEECKQRG